jgi:hypothetical protein
LPIIGKIRGIGQAALFEHVPDFVGHFGFDGGANEKEFWFEIMFQERFPNPL